MVQQYDSRVGDVELDQIWGHKIKDWILYMYFRHHLPVCEAQHIMRSNDFVKGILMFDNYKFMTT